MTATQQPAEASSYRLSLSHNTPAAACVSGSFSAVCLFSRHMFMVPAAGLNPDAPDVPVTGWNSSKEQYAFAYLSEDIPTSHPAAAAAAAPTKLLVKSLVLGESLLTTLATDSGSVEPKVLELPVSDYVMTGEAAAAAAGSSAAKTYKNLDQLTKTLNTAVSEVTGSAAAAGGNSSSQKKQKTEDTVAATAAGGGSSSSGRGDVRPSQPDPDADFDPLRIGPVHRPPLRVGEHC